MKLSTKVSDSSNPTSIKDATKEISKAMTLIANKLAAIHLVYNFDDIITTIGQSLDALSDALINAGCKPEYLASYKTWGDYGWTISPKTGKKFFLKKAESLQSADETMRQFCSIENIVEINNILCSHGVNSNDLEIAKTCYENHQYKPCAMLLFSMIDGYLIDQKIFGVGKDSNQFLKTGLSTVLVLKENDDKVFTDDDFLCMLQYKLIIHGLMSLFKQCKNFENEPSVINRNFLMHGKSTKTITDTDCYKLWSALYSLVVAYPNLKKQISKNDSEQGELMERIMFDANAFSYLIEQNKISLLEKCANKYEFYITEIQVRELAEIPDDKMNLRIAHALCLCKMRAKLTYVRGVYGVTHYGCCMYSDGTNSTYENLLNKTKSNIDDALIGDAAKRENCTLVTDDTKFITKLNNNGIQTMKFSEFLSLISQEVD